MKSTAAVLFAFAFVLALAAVPWSANAQDQDPEAQIVALKAEIALRDTLIQQQESLLNAYRCLFDTDTHVVPNGCVDGKPAEQADSDTSPIPAAPSWPTADQTHGDWEYLAPDDDGTATARRVRQFSRDASARDHLSIECIYGSSGWELRFYTVFLWTYASGPVRATWHIGATQNRGDSSDWVSKYHRGDSWWAEIDAPNDREMAAALAATNRGTFNATFVEIGSPNSTSEQFSLDGAMDAITPVLAYCDSKLES